MSKTNISATVDEDVAAYVSRDEINASGLINQLLRQHMNGGGGEQQVLEFRMEQVSSEIDSLESQLQTKQNEYENLEGRKEKMQSQEEEVLQKAREALDSHDLREENKKVEYWANELDVSVAELIERLR